MGDYHLPIARLLRDLFPGANVAPAPPITQKTVELGARSSPDFVCSPFKYNLGNYIEALEAGANVLLQTGTGCRYGYYGEVQERILRDLGYDFTFLCLSRERTRLVAAYRAFQALNPRLTPARFARALLLAAARLRVMDRLDALMRERVAFEAAPGSFDQQKKAMLAALMRADSLWAVGRVSRMYQTIYGNIAVNFPQTLLRVGLVGELYTLMEPFSNHLIERQLAGAGIAVTRRMSATFLLFDRGKHRSHRRAGGYLRYCVGANGADSVAQCRAYARAGYDGVLHIKSFGCTPELNAQPALMNLGRDLGIPVLHLSFDTQTAEAGVQTRLEAFADMIKMKRENSHEASSHSRGGRGLHLHQGRFS